MVKGNRFYEGLSIPVVEFRVGEETYRLMTVEAGHQFLVEAVEQHICTADEAQGLGEMMVKGGVKGGFSEIITHVVNQATDVDMMGLSFRVCSTCDLPLVHGNIFRSEEEIADTSITQTEGFMDLQDYVMQDLLSVQQAANLFKKMVEVGLALDNEELNERYKALDDDVRTKFDEACRRRAEARAVVRSFMEVFNIGGMSMISTDMIDYFGEGDLEDEDPGVACADEDSSCLDVIED